MQARSMDAIIEDVAARQHGLMTRAGLLAAGVSRHAIDRRVRTGRLRLVHAGVYQVGPVASPWARELAAVMACNGAPVSAASAAALCELRPPQRREEPVHVTALSCTRWARRPGIRVHRRPIGGDEITRIDNVPVTTPARTVLDLAASSCMRDLERMVARAERAGLVALPDLEMLLARYPRHTGARPVRTLLAAAAPPAFTRSEAEDLLVDLIRAGGLPEPEANVVVHGYEVDFYWRRARFAIEVDGFAYHRSRPAFVRDRQRGSALAAADILVVRLTWHQLTKAKERTLVEIAQALQARLPRQ
jgi:very-short-patch-repair endonuclease